MDAVEGIKKSNAKFCNAFAEHDIEKVTALIADDAWFLPPNSEALIGKDAVCAAYKGMMDSGVTGVTLTSTDVEQFGDTANEFGEYTISVGEELIDRGKYMVVWKRVGDCWLIYRDIINTSLPAAE